MLIKIKDIPLQGRDVEFELEIDSLNQRIATAEKASRAHDAAPCVFLSPVKAEINLVCRGTSVMLSGRVYGVYMTSCGRCAEETQQEIVSKVEIVLQPKLDGAAEDLADEDVAFGYYQDKEVECAGIVEEFLILALPYNILCSEKCRGLCPDCGQNLNTVECDCSVVEQVVDPRFAALKDIKLKH